MTKIIAQNNLLYLRELNTEDLSDLREILQDKETMYAYEAPFSDKKVNEWLSWNLTSYQENGFGLWAVIDQKSEAFIGQCGIVYSKVDDDLLLEIGYLIKKNYWNQGYASSASQLCLKYAKEQLQAQKICSIIRDTNESSKRVAEKNGMRIVKEYYKDYSGQAVKHVVYSVQLIS